MKGILLAIFTLTAALTVASPSLAERRVAFVVDGGGLAGRTVTRMSASLWRRARVACERGPAGGPKCEGARGASRATPIRR